MRQFIPGHPSRHRGSRDGLARSPACPPDACVCNVPPACAAGFKKLIKDANLELKVYDMDMMCRLFMQMGGAKGIGSTQDETLSLGVEQFLTLMIRLAFGRDNPRYVAAKESKKEETVPVLQCVQNLMNEFLPRMHKGNASEFRVALKGDGEAQSVIASYSEKIDAWIKKLAEKCEQPRAYSTRRARHRTGSFAHHACRHGMATRRGPAAVRSRVVCAALCPLCRRAEKSNSDVFTQFIAFLEEKGCLGTRSIEVCTRLAPRH